MSSSTSGRDDDAPDLVCKIDCVHGMVDALSSVRWKRHQDAVMELSEHGIVLSIEKSGCLQAKDFLKRELTMDLGRPRVQRVRAHAETAPRQRISASALLKMVPGHCDVVGSALDGLQGRSAARWRKHCHRWTFGSDEAAAAHCVVRRAREEEQCWLFNLADKFGVGIDIAASRASSRSAKTACHWRSENDMNRRLQNSN